MSMAEPDCPHPDWAKERLPSGATVCRVCHPKPAGDHGRMFY